MMGACVNCGGTDTELVRGSDGHFRKECDDCDHVGGPYTSSYGRDDRPDDGQATLGVFGDG